MVPCKSCLRVTPILPIAFTILLVITIPLWFVFSGTAAASTKDVLQAADLQAPDLNALLAQASSTALTTLYSTRTVALVLLLVALALLLLVAGMDTHSRVKQLRGDTAGRCISRSFVAFSGAGTGLLWLAMLAVVLLTALCTAWFLGAWAGSSVLARVSQMSSSAEQAAARAVDSASFLVGQLKSAQLDVLDRAPAEVKATQWYRDFRKSVQDMDTTVLNSSSNAPNNVCQPGCVSLGLLAGLAGLQDNCICLTNTLTNLQQGLTRTHQNLLPALVGLLLCYLAASWLLIYCAASFAAARRLARDYRLSASGTCPYKHCPSSASMHNMADAAIDISMATYCGGLQGGSKHPAPAASGGSGNSRRPAKVGAIPAVAGAYAVHAAPAGVALQSGPSATQDTQSTELELFRLSTHSNLFGRHRPVAPCSSEVEAAEESALESAGGRGEFSADSESGSNVTAATAATSTWLPLRMRQQQQRHPGGFWGARGGVGQQGSGAGVGRIDGAHYSQG